MNQLPPAEIKYRRVLEKRATIMMVLETLELPPDVKALVEDERAATREFHAAIEESHLDA